MSFLCHHLSCQVMLDKCSSVRAVYLSVELTKERSIFTTTWSRRRPSVLTEYTTGRKKIRQVHSIISNRDIDLTAHRLL